MRLPSGEKLSASVVPCEPRPWRRKLAIIDGRILLNGSGNPNLDAAVGWFRYDTVDPGTCDDTFGTRAPASGGSSLGSGSSAVAFSEAITGLAAGTTYYFVVDSTTGQVLASKSVVGTSKKKGMSIGYSGRGWGG